MRQDAAAPDRTSVEDAIRLLGGTNDEVFAGIAMIDAAAARGDAAALERQALLEAVGCARPQDWDRALDCLMEAAQRGSEAARGQMLVLAGATSSGAHEQPDWKALRAEISIGKLMQAPPKIAVSDSPRLRMIEGFASPAECKWVVDRACTRLRPATVVNLSGSMAVGAVRTNSMVEHLLPDMDLVIEAIRARVSAATRLPLPLFEASQALHYAPGQEFRPHHDYFDPTLPGHAGELEQLGQRIATFLIWLNDGYTGGETAFPRAQLSFRGKTGDALFIANVDRGGRPDPSTLHAGRPPLSGEKWIFSQWIRDKAPSAPPPAHS